jgi:hypothetical protein
VDDTVTGTAVAGSSLYPRSPTAQERWLFVVVAFLYGAAGVAVLPWAAEPGLANPRIAVVAGTAILVADLSTALLLGALYRTTGRPPFLALTCAYLYSGLMAGLHMTTFPGALWPEPLFGTRQTVAWLYLTWRIGTAALLLAAVGLEARRPPPGSPRTRGGRLALAVVLVGVTCALVAALASVSPVAALVGDRWSGVNFTLVWLAVAMCAAALVVIWRRHAFDDSLYLWLAWCWSR